MRYGDIRIVLTDKIDMTESKYLWLVPAIASLIALLPMPYGFYMLLRIVVCSAGAYIAYVEYQRANKANHWCILFGVAAFVFNPIVPIHLERSLWALLNIGTALLFLFHRRARSVQS